MGRFSDVRDSAVVPVRLAGPAMLVRGDAPVGISRVWWDGSELLVDVVATRPKRAGEQMADRSGFGSVDRRFRPPRDWEGPTLRVGEVALDAVRWHSVGQPGNRRKAAYEAWHVRYAAAEELAPRFGHEPFVVSWPAADLPITEVAAPELRLADLPPPARVWQAPVAGTPTAAPPAASWSALLRSRRLVPAFPLGVPIGEPVVLARTDTAALVLEDVDASPASLVLSIAGYATRLPVPARVTLPGRGWRPRRGWRRRIREDLLKLNPRLWVGESLNALQPLFFLAGGGGDRHGFRCRGTIAVGHVPGRSLIVVVSWHALELSATATTPNIPPMVLPSAPEA